METIVFTILFIILLQRSITTLIQLENVTQLFLERGRSQNIKYNILKTIFELKC